MVLTRPLPAWTTITTANQAQQTKTVTTASWTVKRAAVTSSEIIAGPRVPDRCRSDDARRTREFLESAYAR